LPPEAFDAAYTQIIVAGRVLSMLLTALFVLVMFVSGRTITRTSYGGLIAAILAAVSWGTAAQSLVLRTELLSSLFVIVAFTATVLAARGTDFRNALWMLMAGLAAALGVATKLQAIVPMLGVVILAVAFGSRPPPYAGFLTPAERKAAATLGVLAAMAAGAPVAVMLVSGILTRESSGTYQALIALYLVSALLAFALIHRLPALRAVTGISALVGGFSLGILLHLLYPNPSATDALATFVEHMKDYAQRPLGPGIPYAAIVDLLVESSLSTLAAHFGGINISRQPLQLVEMLVIVSVIIHALTGNRRTAGLSALLLITGYAVETWSRIRGLPLHYLIYIDPWIALATAMAAQPAIERLRNPVIVIAGASVLATVATLQLSTALSPRFVAPQERANACYQARTYMPQLAHQFQKFCL
jgi:hypothetical protein